MAAMRKPMTKGPIKGPKKTTTGNGNGDGKGKTMTEKAGGVTRTISNLGQDTSYSYRPREVGGMLSKKDAASRFDKAYDARSEVYKKSSKVKSSPSIMDRMRMEIQNTTEGLRKQNQKSPLKKK